MTTDRKTEWMLENTEGRWLHNAEHGMFTSDPSMGLRWPNFNAADAFRLGLRGPLWTLKVTEHVWIGSEATKVIPADEALTWALSTYPHLDWSDLEDDIADAISDSVDMDWTSRDGARAVIALLKALGAGK